MELLKKQRGHLKMRLTLFKKFLANVVPTRLPEDYDSTQAIPQALRFEIENRIAKLNEITNEFYTLQDSIEESIEDPNHDDTLKYREEFENEFFEAIAQAQQILARGQAVPPGPANQNGHLQFQTLNSSHAQQAPFVESKTPGTKLPTVELPKFNGEFESWLDFRDSFLSLIHENNAIKNTQKFHYLRAAVTDSAAEVIKSIKTSDANYEIAWNALRERYDDPLELTHSHIKALYDIKPIVKGTAAQLLAIIDEVNTHLRSLKILEEPTEHWDSLIVYHISIRLDSVSSKEWEKQKSILESKPSLSDMTKFIRTRAKMLHNIESQSKSDSKENKLVKTQPGKSKSFHSQKTECAICKGEHHIQNCNVFLELSPSERANRAKSAKICLNCLRKGHVVKDCSSSNCKKCNAKHNTLLHFDKVSDSESNKVTKSMCSSYRGDINVILATILAISKGPKGSTKARATLDSCSQSSFISSSLCDKLGLKKIPVDHYLDTLNCKGSQIKHMCQITISPLRSNFEFQVKCLVLDEIDQQMPSKPINIQHLKIPKNLPLADPSFHLSGKVDILIGGEWFWRLLCIGQVTINDQGLTLQKTKFGWVVGGPMLSYIPKAIKCCMSKVDYSCVDGQLRKFWELESISDKVPMSEEETSCEQHYVETVKRSHEGRFIVAIPFKIDPHQLGESRRVAVKRLLALEKWFSIDKDFRTSYHAFIHEYEQLGHMTKIKNTAIEQPTFHMPHHGVLRPTSTTTKLRVVFDGSAKSDSGISLNECQKVGPVIQDDLFSILIRFRQWQYVVCADIEKMYRQVLVSPDNRQLQRILWRTDPTKEMETYELNTLTYGTSSASYLAIRSLTQMAIECERTQPRVARIIRSDFYVDDLLTGFNNIEEAKTIVKDLRETLLSGCFPLAKWASNEPSIISQFLGKENKLSIINIGDINVHKTLGIGWQINDDCLIFSINLPDQSKITKRGILSEISQIFDPLGILGPCTVIAKIILQKLWLAKVAPLKTETIPRLELCGAQIVANLASKVRKSLNCSVDKTFLWTDSTIVLNWLQGQSHTLPVFVSNRVSQIQQLSSDVQWGHVSTDQNPADLLSRGIAPSKIVNSKIWWQGPDFLKEEESIWPSSDYPTSDHTVLAFRATETNSPSYIVEFISRYSKLSKLLKIASYCFRVTKHCRRSNIQVNADEANETLLKLIRLVQREDFPNEINILKAGDHIKKGRLASLNPFLDQNSMLRVGGRLRNTDFNIDKKCPILLSSKSRLVLLIFEQGHLDLLHGGPQFLLYHTRERFWTLGGRSLAKKVVHGCITCFKSKPKHAQTQMGDLPRARATPLPAFYNTGVDDAGPFYIRDRKGRGSRTSKCYICLLVCFSTKALHLEVVSDLSTDSFIAAMRRFVSRRGKPQHMYSDNGTTFIGAKNELTELGNFLRRELDALNFKFDEMGIHWHFIPAYSPHQGGLWEAGVRSTKHHLLRIAGKAALTFEEMYTLVTQIEAILNSRPLTPLSDDPNDYTPITPAHFLIGRTYTSIADPSLMDIKESRLSRWQHIQQIQQHFWARWSKEYISELQGRTKWKCPYPAVPINTLVLIKDENLPPTYWKLGRIMELHPGADQVARVATVKTGKGLIKRALVKLCPLPLERDHC